MLLSARRTQLVLCQTYSCGFCAVCLPARGVPAPRRSPAATRHGAVRAIKHPRASTPNFRLDSALASEVGSYVIHEYRYEGM